MHVLYAFASYVLFALAAPFLALMRKTRGGWSERMGWYPRALPPSEQRPRIWLHGASAGDLLALSPMVERLRGEYPNAFIALTTITNAGFAIGHQRLEKHVDAVLYAPWDLPGATRRAVEHLKPDLLVLEYTEIWPNLIHAVRASGAKIALTNGRFSSRQLARYRLLFSLIGNPLRALSVLLMREESEADRARALGAAPDRVQVTGNTKFDALLPLVTGSVDHTLSAALGLDQGSMVLIAGSTHEGEEPIVLDAFKELRGEHPTLSLIIAPRYLERLDRVQQLASDRGFAVARRSTGNPTKAPVVLLDTMGELAHAYRLATVVFIGGSFTTRGGQNILEPAAHGKPVLFGPHMENFHDSVQLLVGRGAIQVNDGAQLTRVLRELLARPEALERLGALAKATVSQVSGASQRNVDVFARLLAEPGV